MSAEHQIIAAYHRTTSSRGGELNEQRYRESAAGLQRRLRGWLPATGQAVLDLGCGTGALLYLLHRLGCHSLTGVNLCQEEIALAQRLVPADFKNSDLVQFLRDTEDAWDWIGCLNILEHLTKDEVLETLQLCARRLRPGGSVIVMVPNGLSAYSGVTRYWDFTHKLAFVPNNFRQLLPLCGFDSVAFRECGPIPHGPVSALRYALWQLVRQSIRLRLMIEVADAKDGIYTMDMLVRLTKRQDGA
jgi:SAM-dependent methyltransferase